MRAPGDSRLAAAVVLAGGRGRRLGGVDKPALNAGGRTLLQRALDAVTGVPVVVVGPDRGLSDLVRTVREEPPGGGPAAALATGWLALPDLPPDAVVAALAADLPGITRVVVQRLTEAMNRETGGPGNGGDLVSADGSEPGDPAVTPALRDGPVRHPMGGAIAVDPDGRRQYLIGVWRQDRMARALSRRPDWTGRSLRELLAPVPVIEVPMSAADTADIDTPDDWARWRPPTDGSEAG